MDKRVVLLAVGAVLIVLLGILLFAPHRGGKVEPSTATFTATITVTKTVTSTPLPKSATPTATFPSPADRLAATFTPNPPTFTPFPQPPAILPVTGGGQ